MTALENWWRKNLSTKATKCASSILPYRNRVLSATNGSSSGTYTYDGNGIRVKKISGGTTTVTIFFGGQTIAEYLNGAAPTAPTNEYIYSGGQIVAAIQSGTTYK
jgi:hypothetical protein